MKAKRNFFIDGQWVPPVEPRDFPVLDPSNEQSVAVISLGGPADADRAVAAAKAAFPSWSQSSVEHRAVLLENLQELYEKRKVDMVYAMVTEMGAPISLSESAQWASGADHLAETIRALRAFPFAEHANQDILLREPIGVAALITPWNWPMNQVMLKVAPALATGCTVVLKPSEIAPLSSILLAELIEQAGFPAGVFNLVNGDGPGVGARLAEHVDVDVVSLTGSTRAGALVTKASADTVKRVSLELGGKGANILFEDADLQAVERGVLHCMENSGQSCDAPTRMLVQRPIYHQAVKRAAEVAQSIKVDSAHKSGDHIGPLVSKEHWAKVQGHIQSGVKEGARLIAGGTGLPGGMEEGYFARPTIFADVTNDMSIAQEEIFGPVLCILPFDSEEEAIAIANDTPFGLANYVQTADPARASRVAAKLRSGMVRINGASAGLDTPFGGYRQSGSGREGSRWGLEEFLEIKVISGAD
ncbi:aldehyde dehydrogenase family protein [Pelagimonas sp. KU-00592-HH]|uniref:aldehyde dehydrogenase family protein n=1 Tax=Pelagimonas sp. KU-00592-HH TaxID=3127651 RepID=UPI0033401959